MRDPKLLALETLNQAIRHIQEAIFESAPSSLVRSRMTMALAVCRDLVKAIEADWPTSSQHGAGVVPLNWRSRR